MTLSARSSSFLFFSIILSLACNARVLPADKAKAHSTVLYFEEEFVKNAAGYKLVLAKDSLFRTETGKGFAAPAKWPAFIADSLEWGQSYYWKVRSFDASGKLLSESPVHRFSTVEIKTPNFDEMKLKVNKNLKAANAGGYIFVDNTRSLFNRDGRPVWTLPMVQGVVDEKTQQVRDFKLTANKTITFLAEKVAAEIDFEGNVLWKAPFPFIYKGDTIAYHHEFRKEKSGNYYVLGGRAVYRKLLVKLPDDAVKNEDMVKITDTGVYRKIEVSVILKFDKQGHLLWSWDSNDYISDIDLNFKKSPSGFPNFNSHANAFSIDEANGKAYLGFRDLSRIIRIDMKSGRVEMSYGEKYPSGEARKANIFRAQHDASITPRKTLLIVNNNGARGGGISSVMEIKDNAAPGDSILCWKFGFDFDTLTSGKSIKGGNATELKNGNLLVCAGEMNRIFEVTRKKEIVWDAFLYSRGKNDTTWQKFPQYRCSYFEKPVIKQSIAKLETAPSKTGDNELQAWIANSGNVSARYSVTIKDKSNATLKRFSTQVLKPGDSAVMRTGLKSTAGGDFVMAAEVLE